MFKVLRNILKEKTENIAKKLTEKEISEEDLKDLLWDLEISLLESNVSLEVVEKLIEKLKSSLVGKKMSSLEIRNTVKKALKELLEEMLPEGNILDELKDKDKPWVVLLIGFNGNGKTTTVAKLASFFKDEGYSVVMAAGDTYRAAAIEQLEEHGKRLNVRVIKGTYGGDAAAVIYDAIAHAKSHKIDVVLGDTAGRVHVNKNLIEELKKIVRVTKPHLVLLVVDSTTGSDAITQAKLFGEVGFDGFIITKFDVDDKGGTILNVSYASSKKIFFLGVGQDYKDLKMFNKKEIIDKLLDF